MLNDPAATPTPTTTRSKQIDELKGTIVTQDQTISTLQIQFASLRASHESHIAKLSSSHSAEVASLKNYARVLEEQLTQRPSHGMCLPVCDTTAPLSGRTRLPMRGRQQQHALTTEQLQATIFCSSLTRPNPSRPLARFKKRQQS